VYVFVVSVNLRQVLHNFRNIDPLFIDTCRWKLRETIQTSCYFLFIWSLFFFYWKISIEKWIWGIYPDFLVGRSHHVDNTCNSILSFISVISHNVNLFL